jgi:hypothetical protein
MIIKFTKKNDKKKETKTIKVSSLHIQSSSHSTTIDFDKFSSIVNFSLRSSSSLSIFSILFVVGSSSSVVTASCCSIS